MCKYRAFIAQVMLKAIAILSKNSAFDVYSIHPIGLIIKMMKRFISSVLVLGVCLTPLTVPVMVQPSWGQSQNAQVQELERLIQQATQQQQQEQPQQAIETWQQILAIARQLKDRGLEGLALNDIGFNYDNISQPQEALKYYNQALPIRREVGDRRGEATTLNNIGAVYRSISKPQEALKYYNQALAIAREIGDRTLESQILDYIKVVNNSK